MKRSRPFGLTPAGLVLRAAILYAAFLAMDAAGWREHTSIICGMGQPGSLPTILAIAYALSWFALVLIAPAFAIAAVIYALILLATPFRPPGARPPGARAADRPSGP